MAAKEKVLDRIRKLLALARDRRGSAEESAVAAAAAQRLMLEHQIAETDLSVDDGIDLREYMHEEGRRATGRIFPPWKLRLASSVAVHSSVRLVQIANGLRMFGYRQDCEIAQYLFQYLVNEIDRLADESWAVFRASGRDGRTWKQQFREGAVLAVTHRLDEMRRTVEQAVPAGAMVLRSRISTVTSLLERYCGAAQRNPWDGLRAHQLNNQAFQQGIAAGDEIALQRGGPALGVQKRALEEGDDGTQG